MWITTEDGRDLWVPSREDLDYPQIDKPPITLTAQEYEAEVSYWEQLAEFYAEQEERES